MHTDATFFHVTMFHHYRTNHVKTDAAFHYHALRRLGAKASDIAQAFHARRRALAEAVALRELRSMLA